MAAKAQRERETKKKEALRCDRCLPIFEIGPYLIRAPQCFVL